MGRRSELPIPRNMLLVRNWRRAERITEELVIGSEISRGMQKRFCRKVRNEQSFTGQSRKNKKQTVREAALLSISISENIRVGEVSEAVIKIDCQYEPQEGHGNYPPLVQMCTFLISPPGKQNMQYLCWYIKNLFASMTSSFQIVSFQELRNEATCRRRVK